MFKLLQGTPGSETGCFMTQSRVQIKDTNSANTWLSPRIVSTFCRNRSIKAIYPSHFVSVLIVSVEQSVVDIIKWF